MATSASFWAAHIVEIYIFYAVSFVVLGVALYLQPNNPDSLPVSRRFGLLSAFALLHGTNEFFGAWRISMGNASATAEAAGALLLVFSYLPLFEFARRGAAERMGVNAIRRVRLTSPWSYVPIAALLVWLMAAYGSAGLSAGGRYLLGLPGAWITGLIFLPTLDQTAVDSANRPSRVPAYVAAVAFMIYAVLAGGIIESVPDFPAWLPTTRRFLEATGLPVQLLRALCAFAAAVAVTRLGRECAALSLRRERAVAAELRVQGELLEQRVAARTAKLDTANCQLREQIAEHEKTTRRALRLNRLLNTLGAISPALLAAKDETQLFAAICNTLVEQGGFSMAWIGFAIPETGRVRVAYQAGFAHGYLENLDIRYDGTPEGQGPTGTAIRNGQTAINDDTETNVLFGLWRERAREFGYRSSAAIPLRFQGQVVGGLSVYAKTPHAFGNEEVVLLEKLAGDLGLAVDRLRTEIAIREAEARERDLRLLAQHEQGRMAALLSAMSIGILFEDRDSRIQYVNPAFKGMWAIPETVSLTGQPVAEVLQHSTHRFARPDHASRYVLRVLDTHEISERFEIDLFDGRILTQISYPVSAGDGRIIGRLWIYADVTHERQTAAQLLYLAQRDPLTGLYNRHRFQERLEQVIATSSRMGTRFALLYFDLDEFKYINDTFGHGAGDRVLVRMAGEIAHLVRSSEIFARLGGDEFAVLTQLQPEDDLNALPKRIVSTVAAIPLRFRGSNLRLTASIGVAVFPDHGETAEDLIAHADTAMYQAKRQGKNTWFVYDPTRDLSGAMATRLTWNHRIGQALEENGLELHFQGIYRAADGALSHLEALIRMRDRSAPERLIMPNLFIPHAEKSGQIVEIDRWVIRRSIELLKAHSRLPALAVNVSGRSVDEPSLPQFIRAQLEEQGVDPRRLIVELTETAAVSDVQDAQHFIETLQRSGCRVALDDFGSGFSTFAYLKHLAVEMLKIDGLFISDLPNNPDNQAFVRAMAEIARGLHKVTIAEFVEDQATLEMVRDMGIGFVQGYHIDRPSADHPALK